MTSAARPRTRSERAVPDGSGPASKRTPAVEARGLAKRFGAQIVLDGVDLRVEPGERVAVLGLNGAGKTTLFRCLLGLCEFEGELRVAGRPAGPTGKEARRCAAYLPQLPPRYDLTLEEFVRVFSALRGVPPAGPVRWLEELDLELEAHGTKRLRELSGGMLQKALLAMALGSEAPVLLLDEPTANLDAASRRDFLRAIGRARPDTTVLFASHRLDDVESLATRLLVLHRGRFRFDGTVEELLEAAGADVGLWIEVPSAEKERVARELAGCSGVRATRANGAGVEVEVERGGRVEALLAARDRGLPLLDFRTRPPALEELMARLVAGGSTAEEDG